MHLFDGISLFVANISKRILQMRIEIEVLLGRF